MSGQNELAVGTLNVIATVTKRHLDRVSTHVQIAAPDGGGLEPDQFVMAVSASTLRVAIEHLEKGRCTEHVLGLLDQVAEQLQVQSGAVTQVEERRLPCPCCGL